MALRYTDEEGDTVKLCSTEDVHHVIALAQQTKGGLFRLTVVDIPQGAGGGTSFFPNEDVLFLFVIDFHFIFFSLLC